MSNKMFPDPPLPPPRKLNKTRLFFGSSSSSARIVSSDRASSLALPLDNVLSDDVTSTFSVSVSGDRFLAELVFSVDTSLAVLFTMPVPTVLSESDGDIVSYFMRLSR
uniref:Uncharacterized protein n=1 Tax=Sipha flava TaxID=143950 RepID=A0A2S2Q3T9_9HEMI